MSIKSLDLLAFPTNVVAVKFKSPTACDAFTPSNGKKYWFKVLPDQILEVGDSVVVDCSTGLQVAEVVQLNIMDSDCVATKYVIGKVDMQGYKDYLQRQEELKMVEKELEKKKKELEGMLAYELLAEKDPKFREVLERYKELKNSL